MRLLRLGIYTVVESRQPFVLRLFEVKSANRRLNSVQEDSDLGPPECEIRNTATAHRISSMTSQSDVRGRAGKLLKLFNDVTKSKRKISTPADAQLFLEAVQNQQPSSLCIETIISRSSGLEAVRSCVRVDLTLASSSLIRSSSSATTQTLALRPWLTVTFFSSFSWSSHNRQQFGTLLYIYS